jgi:Ca2+-binding EF-hand superfamily protein
VDEVFAQHGETTWGIASMRGTPTAGCSPFFSNATLVSHLEGSEEDELRLDGLLNRLAGLVKGRGVIFKDCYTDTDRASIASPSMQNPRRGGKCTKNQFIRGFPFKKEFTPEELEFICKFYTTENGSVHFMALHHEVDEIMVHEPQPFPQSHLVLKPDTAEWEHKALHPVKKLRAKIVERRIRVEDTFKDFDALRKGFCTVGQVKTAFTILNIAKEINREEFDTLIDGYLREDGMFCYTDFVRHVESDFTTPYLEKTPTAQIIMPNTSHTAPARRNSQLIDSERKAQISALEDKMRYRVRTRGMLLKPTFQDLDQARRGYVTRNQFARVMAMLGWNLSQHEINLLCEAYCTLGNHTDVNYIDLIASLDPLPADQVLALEQSAGPVSRGAQSKYFDAMGRITAVQDMW